MNTDKPKITLILIIPWITYFTTIHDGNFRRHLSCYATIRDGNFRRTYYSYTGLEVKGLIITQDGLC